MPLWVVRSAHPLPLHHPLRGRSPSPSKLGEDFGEMTALLAPFQNPTRIFSTACFAPTPICATAQCNDADA